ncbi:hypothetical protein M6B38_382285 [Iris pallida]|uniref:Uncharacterized protein n=1 Tax=Iris pallida TaxID=29817 RepID=A0AAX6G7F4_IRIPA|nr:hypothetical protein M6B38_382285 [Iris pallida]
MAVEFRPFGGGARRRKVARSLRFTRIEPGMAVEKASLGVPTAFRGTGTVFELSQQSRSDAAVKVELRWQGDDRSIGARRCSTGDSAALGREAREERECRERVTV